MLHGGGSSDNHFQNYCDRQPWPEAYNLKEIDSFAPSFQCYVPTFILFQAAAVFAYSISIDRGGGREGEKCERETALSS